MVTIHAPAGSSDVVALFERAEENVSCPFGPQYCGTGPHYPLHSDLLRVREQMVTFLKTSTFARFVGWTPPPPPPPEKGGKRSRNIPPKA